MWAREMRAPLIILLIARLATAYNGTTVKLGYFTEAQPFQAA